MTRPLPVKVFCTARSSRTGDPCRLPPMKGGTVCQKHGGRAPQVLAKAKVRLQMAADEAVKTVESILRDDSVSAADRLKAAVILLDRAGFTTKTELEIGVTLKPWEQLLGDGAVAFEDENGKEALAHVHNYEKRDPGDVVAGEVVYDADDDPNGEV